MSITPGCLERLRAELSVFSAALDDEAAALAATGQEGLAAAVEAKSRQAETVAACWREAAAWLRQASPETGGVPSDAQTAWQEILNLASRVKTHNERNAHLIEAQMQRTRAALDVLQAAARPVNLYGSDGHLENAAGLGHTLDKA